MLTKFTNHALLRARPGAQRTPSINTPCNDNRPAAPRATVSRRTQRPVLTCHWHVVPATGALECFWQDESADGAAAPSPWRSRMRQGSYARLRVGRAAA
jgi:hypothetical protein